MLAAIAVAAGAATLCGGLLALRLRGRIHLILGFSAGAMIAVALLELVPEALGAAARPAGVRELCGWISLGFLGLMILDRLLQRSGTDRSTAGGHLGAASLTVHSVFDGLGIGLAFQASAGAGLVVAVAVMAHDFADGANTVNLGLAGGLPRRTARRWLLADAAAPTVGIVIAGLLVLPQTALARGLAILAGSFLYLGAGKLLPESHGRHPFLWTSAAATLGFGFIDAVVSLAGGT